MVAAFDRPNPSPLGADRADDDGVTIAVDAMGGDHGPTEVVPGALDHARAHPADRVLLVGDEATIRGVAGALPANVAIVHASEVVGMDEHPAMALREKKDSTILVATELVKRGDADALVTAGHTGAGMAAAVLRLGRLPGVDRPALAVQLITDGGTLVLLDIGANPDSSPENLAQYARMGSIFSERVLGVAKPRVALLSIGEEKGKGDLRIQQATELLDQTDLNFVGNVEGKDLTRHEADVVVCDAVLGNVVIKFFEGLSTYIFDLFRAEFSGSLRGRLAYLLLRPGIARIRDVFDYERVGGSPLLGVKGTVIITHGRAKRRMIGYGVGVAATMARTRVPELIAEALRPTPGQTTERQPEVAPRAAPEAVLKPGLSSAEPRLPPARPAVDPMAHLETDT
ncbi:MAG: phosphate acyltransferase PlsX [Candidatus Limnocylindrales bacterium]